MRSLPKTPRSLRRTKAETISSSLSITSSYVIQFSRTIESDNEEKKKFDGIFHDIGGSSGVIRTDNTVPKQILDKSEAAISSQVLDPSTHPEASKDTSDIDAVDRVTPQIARPKLNRKVLMQNAKRKCSALEAQLLFSKIKIFLKNKYSRFTEGSWDDEVRLKKHIATQRRFQTF